MLFAGDCLGLTITLDPMRDRAQPFKMDFNVDYRRMARADSLFKWKDGAIRGRRPLTLEGPASGRSAAYGHGYR